MPGYFDTAVKLAEEIPSPTAPLLAPGVAALGLRLLANKALHSDTPITSKTPGVQLAALIPPQHDVVDGEKVPRKVFELTDEVGWGGPVRQLDFDNGKVTLHRNSDIAALAHEVGHALPDKRLPGTKALYTISNRYTKWVSPLIAGLAAGEAAAEAEDPTRTVEEKLQNLTRLQAGLAVAAAPTAPVLIEEARASALAVKMLTEVPDVSHRRAAVKLLPAFGTYAAAAALPITVAAYIHKLKKSLRESQED